MKIIFSKKHFAISDKIRYFNNALAKSSAERGNSNYKQVANSSTPLTRAFFVRDFRTPKEKAILKNQERLFLSMVACDWQRLIVGCVPLVAVFHPVARYRPKAWKLLAVTLENITSGVTQMHQFIFAAIKRTDLTNKIHKIRINATTEQEARKQLAKEFILFFAGKIALKNHRALCVEGVVYA